MLCTCTIYYFSKLLQYFASSVNSTKDIEIGIVSLTTWENIIQKILLNETKFLKKYDPHTYYKYSNWS